MEDKLNNTADEKEQTDDQPVYTDPNADIDAETGVNTGGAAETDANANGDAGQAEVKPVYTDPNADVTVEDTVQSSAEYQYTRSQGGSSYAGYQQNDPSRSGQSSYSYQGGNYQYQQTQSGNSQYQDNLNYNIGNNMGYNQDHYQDMDTSPMSMGDWLLTILVAMIPCAGIVLYIVWAFGSTGNVNRRNFCRAQLIVLAGVFVLYLILAVVMVFVISVYN